MLYDCPHYGECSRKNPRKHCKRATRVFSLHLIIPANLLPPDTMDIPTAVPIINLRPDSLMLAEYLELHKHSEIAWRRLGDIDHVYDEHSVIDFSSIGLFSRDRLTITQIESVHLFQPLYAIVRSGNGKLIGTCDSLEEAEDKIEWARRRIEALKSSNPLYIISRDHDSKLLGRCDSCADAQVMIGSFTRPET